MKKLSDGSCQGSATFDNLAAFYRDDMGSLRRKGGRYANFHCPFVLHPYRISVLFRSRLSVRYWFGHYERQERRAACVWGAFGALIIPAIWIAGCLEDKYPGRLGKMMGTGIWLAFMFIIYEFIRRIYATQREGK